METLTGTSVASCPVSASRHPPGNLFRSGSPPLAVSFRWLSPGRPIFLRFPSRIASASSGDLQSCQSRLESLFCYDKPIPEERIEEPIGLSLSRKEIGDKTPCMDCELKGAVLCATCSGSGLYVDSILECQGIIVKVRCLGCGGSGNIMCSSCGGRGHL